MDFLNRLPLIALLLIPFGMGWTEPAPEKLFSELPPERQRKMLESVQPPPLAERDNPYSTPMYYLFAKGYADGIGDSLVLDRNRPDWQETLIADWAELGLTSTHFLTYPAQWETEDSVEAIRDYFRLSKQYGLGVGIRLGGDESFGGLEASGWDLHPNNPDNRIEEYADWVGRVAREAKGVARYYVVGDELNGGSWETEVESGKTASMKITEASRAWTPERYLAVFIRIAAKIREQDPGVDISMFGMSGVDIPYFERLLAAGYEKVGNGAAANFGYRDADRAAELTRLVRDRAPKMKIFSNGVGYVGAEAPPANPVNHQYPVFDEKEQAALIAKTMITTFALDWDAAPYYITLRGWHLPDGEYAAHWYGFFGFQELKLDSSGKITVQHFPAWHAFRTLAHVLHSRDQQKASTNQVTPSAPVSALHAFENPGRELMVVLWVDQPQPVDVTLTLGTTDYGYPIRIDWLDLEKHESLKWTRAGNEIRVPDIAVGAEPVYIRLFPVRAADRP